MIDDNSPPNTAYNFHRTVLSEEQLYSEGAELKSLRSSKYLTTQESKNLFRSDRRLFNNELLPSSDPFHQLKQTANDWFSFMVGL
jgi:hypothetical protein